MNDLSAPLLPHGGYKNLRAYQVAEVVYDATVVFCDRFIDKRSRTHDQMVQAARSGVRNISEGSGAAATSKKTEIHLTNVARSSLADELLKDYRSFLVHRGLSVWDKDSKRALAMRERLKYDIAPGVSSYPTAGTVRLKGMSGLVDFVSEAAPELASNAMLCAVNQAVYLLRRLLERQTQDFVEHGGFSEQLYEARSQERSKGEELPKCPQCGKQMKKRMANKGPNAGKAFWGCSAFPECCEILNIEKKG